MMVAGATLNMRRRKAEKLVNNFKINIIHMYFNPQKYHLLYFCSNSATNKAEDFLFKAEKESKNKAI
jgi:hypothetical protein